MDRKRFLMSLDQTSLARRQASLMITGSPGSLIHCDSSYTAIPGWKTWCTLQVRHWPREVENIGCAGRSASHDNAKPTLFGRKLMTSTYWQNSTNSKCCLTVNKRIMIYAPDQSDQSCNMYQKDSRNPSRCFKKTGQLTNDFKRRSVQSSPARISGTQSCSFLGMFGSVCFSPKLPGNAAGNAALYHAMPTVGVGGPPGFQQLLGMLPQLSPDDLIIASTGCVCQK